MWESGRGRVIPVGGPSGETLGAVPFALTSLAFLGGSELRTGLLALGSVAVLLAPVSGSGHGANSPQKSFVDVVTSAVLLLVRLLPVAVFLAAQLTDLPSGELRLRSRRILRSSVRHALSLERD